MPGRSCGARRHLSAGRADEATGVPASRYLCVHPWPHGRAIMVRIDWPAVAGICYARRRPRRRGGGAGMSQGRILAIAFIAIGAVLALVSVLADQVGLGAVGSSFGWKQLLG